MQFGQEDLERLPFFFPNPHLMASQLAAAAAAAKVKDMGDLRVSVFKSKGRDTFFFKFNQDKYEYLFF